MLACHSASTLICQSITSDALSSSHGPQLLNTLLTKLGLQGLPRVWRPLRLHWQQHRQWRRVQRGVLGALPDAHQPQRKLPGPVRPCQLSPPLQTVRQADCCPAHKPGFASVSTDANSRRQSEPLPLPLWPQLLRVLLACLAQAPCASQLSIDSVAGAAALSTYSALLTWC